MKQSKLGFANPYQVGEGYAVNEMVLYSGSLRIVQTAIPAGTPATGSEFASLVSPEWDVSTFRLVSGTKKVAVDVSSVAAETTRTLTMPNANVNLGEVIVGLAHDAATHVLTMTTPSGNSTLTLPSINVIEVAGNTSLTAKKNSMYVLTSGGTGSTVSFALGGTGDTELLGSTVMWLSACQAAITLTAPEFQWENTGVTATFTSITFTLYPGEMLIATRKSNTVYLNKVSRVVDPAVFKMKNATGNGVYSFSSNATAARTVTLPDGDVDLRYLPRSNYDTGNSLSNGGATVSGTNMTLTARIVVATGSSVSAPSAGGHGCFIGTNHPSSPGNGGSTVEGQYCGFLVLNNSTLNSGQFGTSLRNAGGIAMRSALNGTDNWFGNVDYFSTASSTVGMSFGLVRTALCMYPTKHQVWESVHGMASFVSGVPTYGASLFTSLLRSAAFETDKTLLAKFALSATHAAGSFATVDGSQTANHLLLPPAVLGKKGAACHEVTAVLRQVTSSEDYSSHPDSGACAIIKRRINVYYDPFVPQTLSSVEVIGTDFTVGGTTTVGFTVDLSTASFTQNGLTWVQPLLKITPELLVSGTPVTRSAAVKVESTYIVNEWG